ncbi:MAG: toxin-antitoxin system YwqK family antitoxin [Bacteroidales bacterium]|jgi:antitoxin component YwqK of YwqJK toxin-antitoxin module|nr:toxin-antitoxin system YwqK family antitoxin [Bacteroidales bacterium]
MNLKIITIASLLAISVTAACQSATELNKTDPQGRKQGPWIKKYPGGLVQYEGTFKDNHPVGEFKRYFEDQSLRSVLLYSSDGKEASATIYHPNGYISSEGKYINQMKEGKWKFFSSSVNGYLIQEEEYSKNLRNGLSLKFFPDSTLAEKVRYINDRREGEWLQYYESGKIFLRTYYTAGMLNGKFEVWFENGNIEYSGYYKNNLRDGSWRIFKEDGTLKYELNYIGGIAGDNRMEKEAAEFLDKLESTKGKIPDPEKTGTIR